VGGPLRPEQWTAWVASIVTIQLLMAMLSLLIKMLLLVTGFEANGTEMFESFALLTCTPMGAFIVLGFDRVVRGFCTNRCCSFVRHSIRFIVGLGLMLGGVYYLVFAFGGIAEYTVSHLDTAWWDLTCVVLTMISSFYIAMEILRMGNGYETGAHEDSSTQAKTNILKDVAQNDVASDESPPQPIAIVSLKWALQHVDESDEGEAAQNDRQSVDLRPQHITTDGDMTTRHRMMSVLRGLGLFWKEFALWLLERQFVTFVTSALREV